MFKVHSKLLNVFLFCSCMLFTVYICGCHSLLSVNISAQEGCFGNMLWGAWAFVGIAKCPHTSLRQGWRNRWAWGLFVCCVKVDVNWVYVTVFIVSDSVHEVGCPCRCA